MCRSKHVEQLRNTGIINSNIRSHFVGYFYKIHVCRLFLPVRPSVRPSVLVFLTSVHSVHGCCKGIWTIRQLLPIPPSICCMVTLFALHFPGEMGTRYVCWLGGRGEMEGGHFPYRNILQKGRCPTPTHNHVELYFLNNPPGGTNSQTLL